jgi:hypothetical protein
LIDVPIEEAKLAAFSFFAGRFSFSDFIVTTLGTGSPPSRFSLSRNRLTFGFRPRSALHSLLQQV